jgi:hypothetical protein
MGIPTCLAIMSYLILGLSAILADIPGRIAVPISGEIWLSALVRADFLTRKTIGVRRVPTKSTRCPPTKWNVFVLVYPVKAGRYSRSGVFSLDR